MRRRDPFELRHNLRAIWVDGIGFSVKVGMGETYFPAFALALGLPDVLSGLVATLPMLCGSFVQLVSAAWIRRVGSLKRWAVLCAALQAASFVPLVVAALAGSMPALLLNISAAWYWAAGLSIVPSSILLVVSDDLAFLFFAQLYSGAAWAAYELSTFLSFFDAIPARERVSVLTRFNVTNSSAIFAGSLCGGFVLGVLGSGANAFVALFAISCALRLATLFLLRRIEPLPFRGLSLSTDTVAIRAGTGSFEQPISAAAPGDEAAVKSDRLDGRKSTGSET